MQKIGLRRITLGLGLVLGVSVLTAHAASAEEPKCYAVTKNGKGGQFSQRIDCTTGAPIFSDVLRDASAMHETQPNGPTVPVDPAVRRRLRFAVDFDRCTVNQEAAYCLKAGR